MNLLSLNSEGAFRTTIHRRIPQSSKHSSAESKTLKSESFDAQNSELYYGLSNLWRTR